MRYLVATDSVHTTAAACDYLDPRLETGDEIDVLTVVGPDDEAADRGGPPGAPSSGRDAGDAGDAANVAAARLAGRAIVETLVREGPPAETIRSAVGERDPDVVLIGTHGGRPGAGPGLGSVARSIVENLDRPVVVLPLPELDA